MENKNLKKYLVKGDTYEYRTYFKRAGWKWDPFRKGWESPEKVESIEEDKIINEILSSITLIDGIRNRGNFWVQVYEA